jgi:hypothetical protein
VNPRDIINQLKAAGRIRTPEVVPQSSELDHVLDSYFSAVGDVYDKEMLNPFIDARHQFFDGSRDTYLEIANGLYRDLTSTLSESDLGIRLADPDRSAIAVEDLDDFNATSFALGESWITLIDQKLIEVLYATARAFCGRVNRPTDTTPCEACSSAICNEISLCTSARRWFETGWRAQHGARQIAELWTPTGEQFAYANALAVNAEMFVLAHEIAHHVAGDTADSAVYEPVVGEATEFKPSWSMEIKADALGAYLLLNHAMTISAVDDKGNMSGAALIAASVGMEHFLATAELLARVSGPADTGEVTHPPAAVRRNAIEVAFEQNPAIQVLRSFCDDARFLYGKLWETVANPTAHTLSAFAREHELLRAAIARAFEEVVAHGPDHLAVVTPRLNALRSTSSQLLFDNSVLQHVQNLGTGGRAASIYFAIFCDTPPEIAGAIDPSQPFFGLERYVDTRGTFASVVERS